MQGSTYDTVFVDVNNMVFDSNGTPYANQDELLRRYICCLFKSKKKSYTMLWELEKK